jgi:hypothetical protein
MTEICLKCQNRITYEATEEGSICPLCGWSKEAAENWSIRQPRFSSSYIKGLLTKTWKKSEIIIAILVVSVLSSISVYFFQELFGNNTPKYTAKELRQVTPSILKEVANSINKNTPIAIDQETILTHVMPIENILIYNFLVDYSIEQINKEYFLSAVKKIAIERLCTNTSPDIKLVREIGNVSFRYEYYDRNNKYIGQFTFTFSQCD